MYIEHSLMADYFYAGLALLVIASFVARITQNLIMIKYGMTKLPVVVYHGVTRFSFI